MARFTNKVTVHFSQIIKQTTFIPNQHSSRMQRNLSPYAIYYNKNLIAAKMFCF